MKLILIRDGTIRASIMIKNVMAHKPSNMNKFMNS